MAADEPRHYSWLVSLQFGSDAKTKEEAALEVAKELRSGSELDLNVFATSEGWPYKFRVHEDGKLEREE